MAAVGFAIGAVALIGAGAFARAPLPTVDTRDPAAAGDLVALMRAGEHGSWVVNFDFTRTLANGSVLRERASEGRSGRLHVLVSGPSMTIDTGAKSYACAVAAELSGCRQSTVGTTLPASEVLRIAIDAGAYDVVRRPDTTIAGHPARCFRVRATGQGGLPDIGVETDRCFGAGGIPLRISVVRPPGIVDRQIATSVLPHATLHDVEALARSGAAEHATGQR